ncbi:MAG: hypothetical protein KDD03_02335 [Gelidibacter sp.]|nr:hypothetical protein [Gelidibacter sp.]
MKNYIHLIVVCLLVVSCGTKTVVNKEMVIKESQSMAAKTDTNKSLKEIKTEGALTDKEGFKDIGTFKYSEFYDEKTNEILKIKNVETTDKTITETYYFEDNNVYLIVSESSQKPTKKIYVHRGKIVSNENTNSDEQQLLLDKAKRFQKSFKKNH